MEFFIVQKGRLALLIKQGCKITHLYTHLQAKRNKRDILTILKIYKEQKCLQIFTFIR